jgi:hypothetical protein
MLNRMIDDETGRVLLTTQLTKEGILQFSTTRKQDCENCKLKRSITAAPMYEYEQKLFTSEQFCSHNTPTLAATTIL